MNEKESVLRQFGQNAEKYVTSKTHAKGKDLGKVIEAAKEWGKGSLLDIATGGGHVANALAPLFKSVTALDMTPEMLASAKKFITGNGHTNVSFVQGDAMNLPFPDASFETVTCRIAPHHFPDVKVFAKEVTRVLAEMGLFILVDNVAPELDEYDEFYNFVEKKRDPSHVRAYKKSEWISILEHEGLKVKSLTTFPKTFTYDVWTEMMALPEKEKQELTDFMIAAPKHIRDFFKIEITDHDVQSFQGEAVLFIAWKGELLA